MSINISSSTWSPVNINNVPVSLIKQLTQSNISRMSAAQLTALTTEQVAAIPSKDIVVLNKSQLQSIDIYSFTSAQLHALSSKQLAELSSDQVAGLNQQELADLNDSQIKGLDLSKLTGDQFSYLSASAMSGLTNNQLQNLTADQLSSMTATQIVGLSASQLHALSAKSTNNTNVGIGKPPTSFNTIPASANLTVDGIAVGNIAAGGNAVAQGANIAAAINAISTQTGVTATADAKTGAVSLTSANGSDIVMGTGWNQNGSGLGLPYNGTQVAGLPPTYFTGNTSGSNSVLYIGCNGQLATIDTWAAGTDAISQGANVAAAINLQTATTGVTATADAKTGAITLSNTSGLPITAEPINCGATTGLLNSLGSNSTDNYLSGVTPSFGANIAAGAFQINGVNIGAITAGTDAATQAANVIDAINAISATTGVTASLNTNNGAAPNSILLDNSSDNIIDISGNVANTGLTTTKNPINTYLGSAPSSFSSIAAGVLNFNGVPIGAINAGSNAITQGANVAAAINLVSSQSGVKAVADLTTGAISLSNTTGAPMPWETLDNATIDATGLNITVFNSNTGTTTGAGPANTSNVFYSNSSITNGLSSLSNLTDDAIRAITPKQINGLNIKGLSTDQITVLTSGQVSALSSSQLSALSANQLTALQPSQLTKISATQLSNLTNFNDLSEEAISSLSASQLKGINTVGKVQALDELHLSAIITKLTPMQIGELSATQLGNLLKADFLSMSTQQLHAIKPLNIQYLNANELSYATTVAPQFTTQQIAELSSGQIIALSTDTLSNMSAAQIKAVGSKSSFLNDTQIGAISTKAITGLNVAYLNDYTGLTDSQIAVLSNTQIHSLATSGSPSIIQGLSTTGISQWSRSQAESLTASALNSMTTTQQSIIRGLILA